MEVRAGGPAGHADFTDNSIFGDLVADLDVDIIQVGIKSFYPVGVADDDFVAIAEAADFNFGDNAGGGRIN